MKTCTKCKETKPYEAFSIVKSRGKETYKAQCRSCIQMYQKEYLDKNPEKRKEYQNSNAAEIGRLKYKQSDKGKEAARRQRKAYREAHRDEINAKKREDRAKKKLTTNY